MTLSVALLGTNHPAVPTLEALIEARCVRVVVLPESAGKKNDRLIALAESAGVPWTYELAEIDAMDITCVVAANYPNLVPVRYLRSMVCINTHWSLLPAYRGVHPTAWALINGERFVGVTVHRMEEEFDTGEVLCREVVEVGPETQLQDLHAVLAERQALAVMRVLNRLESGNELQGEAQREADALYVPQRVPGDGVIDWTWPTERIAGLVRALPAPDYPSAFTWLDGKRLEIVTARPAATPEYFCTAGQIVRVRKDIGVWVKTGDTCVEVMSVRLEGHDIQPAGQLLKRGMVLGFLPQPSLAELHREMALLNQRLQELETLAAKWN